LPQKPLYNMEDRQPKDDQQKSKKEASLGYAARVLLKRAL